MPSYPFSTSSSWTAQCNGAVVNPLWFVLAAPSSLFSLCPSVGPFSQDAVLPKLIMCGLPTGCSSAQEAAHLLATMWVYVPTWGTMNCRGMLCSTTGLLELLLCAKSMFWPSSVLTLVSVFSHSPLPVSVVRHLSSFLIMITQGCSICHSGQSGSLLKLAVTWYGAADELPLCLQMPPLQLPTIRALPHN